MNLDDLRYKLYIAALDNSEQFLLDAIYLLEKKSYGHAYALAILALEEYGKAWMSFIDFIGIKDHAPWKKGEKAMYSHTEKHLAALDMTIALIYSAWKSEAGIIENPSDEVRRDKELIALVEENKNRYSESLVYLIKFQSYLLNNKKFLDTDKQDGFYVDVKDGELLHSPLTSSKFTKEYAMQMIGFVYKFIQISREHNADMLNIECVSHSERIELLKSTIEKFISEP